MSRIQIVHVEITDAGVKVRFDQGCMKGSRLRREGLYVQSVLRWLIGHESPIAYCNDRTIILTGQQDNDQVNSLRALKAAFDKAAGPHAVGSGKRLHTSTRRVAASWTFHVDAAEGPAPQIFSVGERDGRDLLIRIRLEIDGGFTLADVAVLQAIMAALPGGEIAPPRGDKLIEQFFLSAAQTDDEALGDVMVVLDYMESALA